MAKPPARRSPVRRAVRAVAIGSVGAMAAVGLNTAGTQAYYAPRVTQAEVESLAMPADRGSYEEGRRFFASAGISMPTVPPKMPELGEPNHIVINGLKFYTPRGITPEQELNIRAAVAMLSSTRTAQGSSYIDVVKSVTRGIHVGSLPGRAAGYHVFSNATDDYEFTTKADAKMLKAIKAYPLATVKLNGNAGDGENATVRFGIIPSFGNMLREVICKLGRLRFRRYIPHVGKSSITIDDRILANKPHSDIAEVLVHEAAHGILDKTSHGKKLSKQEEKFAYTASSMFFRDAARQGTLQQPLQSRWLMNKRNIKVLTLDRLGLYQWYGRRGHKTAKPPKGK